MKQQMGTVTVSTGATTMTLTGSSIGGGVDLKLPVSTAESAMPLAPSPPQTHLSSELPMDVDGGGGDNFDLIKNIKQEDGGAVSTTCSNGMFDIPNMMQVEGNETDSFNFNSLGADPSSTLGVHENIENPDGDLNWLDLVMPTSASGLTPVSSTPPTGIEGTGKDLFPFNLFDLNDVSTPTDLTHLEGDAWDNIPVNE